MQHNVQKNIRGNSSTIENKQSLPSEDQSLWNAFLRGEAVMANLYDLSRHDLFQIAETGNSLLRSGQFEQARTVFEALTSLDPTVGEFHCALGVSYQALGMLTHAMMAYDRALVLNEGDTVAQLNRADLAEKVSDL